ncbi:unnamed protein product [Adineta steineri]|uniref:G-protein coupled receptors family 1 profile domain-containing protein n=1 Tax=Adineta steineri TaxID=433720 RepID=A0A819S2P7_9BILA|nr:unnamed protein product [Adineta steineri]CAF4054892.1 unnamed protein product [Adineta steineri]
MSSSSTASTLTLIGQDIAIYIGITILIIGLLGGLLNIIVFLSLKTFRENSCAFYLLIMSFADIGQLLSGLLSRIMISGYGTDWQTQSYFFCKFRSAFWQFCTSMSYTCLCLATIDQYFSTCTRLRWQQWSNIKIAYCLIIIFTIIWSVHIIPYIVFSNHMLLAATGKISCNLGRIKFAEYRNYFVILCLSGFIPDIITATFGIMSYQNIQQIAHRTVPFIRRELDKQLTKMVFIQVIINLFTNTPYIIINTILYAATNVKDPYFIDIIQFLYTVTLILFYTYFCISFYVYMCVSERYRRQFMHVLFQIHLNRCKPQRIPINEVIPID